MGRRIKIKTSVTIDPELFEWAKKEANRLGVSDLSTFLRMLIAADKARKETLNKEK
jgi:hypothetical protein